MTHPVKLDQLLERYEYVPHEASAIYVCEVSRIHNLGCVCSDLKRALDTIEGQAARCENLESALHGWLTIRSQTIEKWADS